MCRCDPTSKLARSQTSQAIAPHHLLWPPLGANTHHPFEACLRPLPFSRATPHQAIYTGAVVLPPPPNTPTSLRPHPRCCTVSMSEAEPEPEWLGPQVAPLSSSNSATSLRAWLVTLRASSTTALGTARDEGVSLFRLLASPGPGPLWPPLLPVPPLPFACADDAPLLPFADSAPLLVLPAAAEAVAVAVLLLSEDVEEAEADEDVFGFGCSEVSLRTSSRICFRRTGNVVASPDRRRARARLCTCVGQLFGCALRV